MTIAVIIPCYKVREHILGVIEKIGPEVTRIYCVDDACPQQTGLYLQSTCRDPRVQVLFHGENQGVGGATLTGYEQALAEGAKILVKVDGDGQMDPRLIPRLVTPLLEGQADYIKGNRFYSLEFSRSMPFLRKVGNAGLSFISKFSNGYWHIFDPTNGFTALHSVVARELSFDRLDRRYFFESDLLFRLNIMGAVVRDMPMRAVYGEESSSLSPLKEILPFAYRHLCNFSKRIIYSYFLRNFSVASIEIVLGPLLLLFGIVYGGHAWHVSSQSQVPATAGTVMMSALPILIGIQFILSFLHADMLNMPKNPLHKDLSS